MFKRKSLHHMVNEADGSEHGLRRVLSATSLTSLGVGAIVGAGIFVATGTVAAQCAGPSLVISLIFSAIGCGLAGLCYAEFASMIPISGSAYSYAYATLGEFIAWIIGWDLILEYLLGASAVSVGWSGYLVSFLSDFGLHFPARLCAATGTTLPDGTVALFNLPAVLIITLLTVLLVIGIKESSAFNNIIVLIKLLVIGLFISVGFCYVRPENWHPFIPPNTSGNFGEFGYSGILAGAGQMFFAYIGFDCVSTAAQEAKNPKRDMPIGIMLSLVICTVLYILVTLVTTGLVKYTQLNVPDPIAVAVNAAGADLNWLRPLVKFGAILGISSVILVLLLGQPRIFYSMSKDGLLPPVFSKLHPRFKTPYVTTIITGLAAIIMAGGLPIGILIEMVNIGTLLAFVIVCVGVIVLRYRHPEFPRAFKTPWMPYVPILGTILSLAMMYSLKWQTWARLFVWMFIGLLVYIFYSYRHSRVRLQWDSTQIVASSKKENTPDHAGKPE